MGVYLAAAVEQGVARADLDVDAAARQSQAMMYGLQVQWLLDPRTDMVARFRAFLEDITRPEGSTRPLSPSGENEPRQRARRTNVPQRFVNTNCDIHMLRGLPRMR